MNISAVQHERKPMLDKKETAATGTVTGNSLASSGSQNRVCQKTGFWRGDFTQNDNSNISNMFPVNFSFAELTSTLAQRGSEYTPFVSIKLTFNFKYLLCVLGSRFGVFGFFTSILVLASSETFCE